MNFLSHPFLQSGDFYFQSHEEVWLMFERMYGSSGMLETCVFLFVNNSLIVYKVTDESESDLNREVLIVWAPFHKGLWLIASFLNTQFAFELRLIPIIRLIITLFETGPWGDYLETGPDPIAMVIRVEPFIHKACQTEATVSRAWVTMQCQFVYVSLGLWVNNSTLITMAIGPWSVSR